MSISNRFLNHAKKHARANQLDSHYFRWYGHTYYACFWYDSLRDLNLFSVSLVYFLSSGHIFTKEIYSEVLD